MSQPESSAVMRAVKAIWFSILILLFAAWWGGLTFYAIIVVPIGTEQVGSIEQGFITQQVTRWHNVLLTAMTTCLAIDALHRKNRCLWVLIACLFLVDVLLLIEHSRLTGMMDFGRRTVPEGFYGRHAIYLWLTAVEWGLGVALAALAVFSCQSSGQRKSPKAPPTS